MSELAASHSRKKRKTTQKAIRDKPEQPSNEFVDNKDTDGGDGVDGESLLACLPDTHTLISQISKTSDFKDGAVVCDFPALGMTGGLAYIQELAEAPEPVLPWRRDDILKELREDETRDARLRRDVAFPDSRAAACLS